MIVSWPRCGWSGKPAPFPMVKWSSIRKGLKLRNFGVPIERRTRAPAPSACSMARKTWRMARAVDIFVIGGMIGDG